MINTNNRELVVMLDSEREVKYESETWDHIKRLAPLCKVYVKKLRLSDGQCDFVRPLTNHISMSYVHIESAEDLARLHDLVSQYMSWAVDSWLYLPELGSDDWELLAQLLPTLTWVGWGVKIKSNSASHPAQETLRQLWDKTKAWGWDVNDKLYRKSDDENFNKNWDGTPRPTWQQPNTESDDEIFDKLFNKYFK